MLFNRITFAICLFFLYPFAASATIPASEFIDDPEIFDIAISADGKYIASLWKRDLHREILVHEIDTMKPVGKVSGGAIRPYAIQWVANDRLLVSVNIPNDGNKIDRKLNKGEEYDFDEVDFSASRLFTMNPDGSNLQVLLEDEGIDGNRLAPKLVHLLPHDPTKILLMAPFKWSETVYEVNISDGKSKRIALGKFNTVGFGFTRSGEPKFRYDYQSVTRTVEVFSRNSARDWDKIKEIDFDKEGETSRRVEEVIGVWEDGLLAYLERNSTTGYYELHARTENGVKVLAAEPNADVLGVLTSPFESSISGYTYEKNDVVARRYFNPEVQKDYDHILDKVRDVGFSSYWSRRSEAASPIRTLFTYGPDDPGAFLLYRKETDEVQFFGFSYPKLNPKVLATAATTKFKTEDGFTIESIVYLPPNFKKDGKFPLVVMPHGGPAARDYLYFDDLAQYIAVNGYVVVKPNFRGSSGYGKTFEEAGHGEWGGKMQQDLNAAVKFLSRKGYIDINKVCMVGGSYGGFAALSAGHDKDIHYKCVASLNGVSDLPAMLSYDRRKFRRYPGIYEKVTKSIRGPNDLSTEVLEAASPVNHAQDFRADTLIVVGMEDRRVPFSQSSKIASKLKKARKQVEYIKLKEVGHYIFEKRKDTILIFEKIKALLDRNIGPTVTAPEPSST